MWLCGSDDMEERARDMSTATACRAKSVALRIEQVREGHFAAGLGQRGIMKFVASHHFAAPAEGRAHAELCCAVAKMQAALGEAGGMRQQACHGVAVAFRILNPFPKNHGAPPTHSVSERTVLPPPSPGNPRVEENLPRPTLK